MLGLLLICFELALPFAVIPIMLRPMPGVILWIALSLFFRAWLSFKPLRFFERFLQKDSEAEADGTIQSLVVSRDLALQTPQARLKIWVSKRPEISALFLADGRQRRVLVLGRAHLDAMDEKTVRALIQKSDVLSTKAWASQLTELTRLVLMLSALRLNLAANRNPLGFLGVLIFWLPLRQAAFFQSRLSAKMGVFNPPSEWIDALLGLSKSPPLLAHFLE